MRWSLQDILCPGMYRWPNFWPIPIFFNNIKWKFDIDSTFHMSGNLPTGPNLFIPFNYIYSAYLSNAYVLTLLFDEGLCLIIKWLKCVANYNHFFKGDGTWVVGCIGLHPGYWSIWNITSFLKRLELWKSDYVQLRKAMTFFQLLSNQYAIKLYTLIFKVTGINHMFNT